jgi:hypothetical protein
MRTAAVGCKASKLWPVDMPCGISHHRLYDVFLLEFLNLDLSVTQVRQNGHVVLS